MFRATLAAASALTFATVATTALAAPPAELWQSEASFRNPESVRHDATRGRLYVSDVDGSPAEADGNGFISTLDPDGSIIELERVTGLDAPKGMAMAGDTLYVSDITAPVEIDIEAGEVVARHEAGGAKFLNDVAADGEGNVYVSDMVTNRIYRLADGDLAVWIDDAALENPNGLLVEGDRLIVGSWGRPNEDFTTDVPGHLKSISLGSGEIEPLGDASPVGNLDGVEPDGAGGYYVTDWMAGALLRISPDGTAETLLDLDQGSADIGWLPDEGMILVPMMMNGKVVAYEASR